MPCIGLGTYPLDDREVREAIVAAADIGYRLIDSAHRYGNETGVGNGVRATGLRREELFVTTKLDGEWQGQDRALRGIDGSLARMKLDYVDLLLIHWPIPKRDEYVSTWRTFEGIAASGKAKSIGVSNFKPAHLERLRAETSVVPAVNQIEMSPYTVREASRVYDTSHGIVTQGWSPLAPGSGLVRDALLAQIGARHGRTAGPGGAPLVRPDRCGAGAQVRRPEADGRELRRVRLRALRGGDGADQHARQGRDPCCRLGQLRSLTGSARQR